MQADASNIWHFNCRLESELKVETPFDELSELEKHDHNKRAEVKRLKKEAKARKAGRDEEVGGSLNSCCISSIAVCVPRFAVDTADALRWARQDTAAWHSVKAVRC